MYDQWFKAVENNGYESKYDLDNYALLRDYRSTENFDPRVIKYLYEYLCSVIRRNNHELRNEEFTFL